jgi:FkbM family methyltransferase
MSLLKLFQKLDDYISYLNSNTINEKSLLLKLLDKNINLIDIGSNYGSYIDFVEENFLIKKCFIFEPSKKNFEKLKTKYKGPNYIIKPYASSNKKGKKMFYEYEVSSMSSLHQDYKLYKSFNNIKKKYLVNVVKLDDIIQMKKIDLCKIDVQGEELNTLKGMKKILSKKIIKLIKIELNFEPLYVKNKTDDWISIINFFHKYKYKLIGVTKIKYNNLKINFMDCYFASSIDF